MLKEIIVFANSVKHHNSCVAGKCTKTKQWIRPVLNDSGAEIPILQTRILNERNRTTWPLTVLQRIKITISHPSPLRHQPENYVIEEKEWTDHYKISFSEALTFLDTPSSLWGGEDRVSYDAINQGLIQIDQSLYLIYINELRIYRQVGNGRRRASFHYNGIMYDLAVTAREFDGYIGENQNSIVQNAIICISLGENFEGHCYKLIASIITERMR